MGRLDGVTARYDAAAVAEIQEHHVPWPGLDEVIRTIGSIRSATDAAGRSAGLAQLLGAAWNWSNLLTGTLTPPAAAGTDVLAERARAVATDGADLEAVALLGRLVDGLKILALETMHPAAEVVETCCSLFGTASDDPEAPDVRILTGREHVEALQRWLTDTELAADVVTLNGLRRAPVRGGLVVLGPPGRTLTGPWCKPRAADRRAGWVLAAPPAREVHVVTWVGHRAVPADGLLPSEPPVTIIGEGRVARSAAVWVSPPAQDTTIRVAGNLLGEREPVDAVGCRLAGDAVAYFADQAGPALQVVDWSDDAVELSRVRLRAGDTAMEGRVVAFWPDRSAADAELIRRAAVWLAGDRDKSWVADGLTAQGELKLTFALVRHEVDVAGEFRRRLPSARPGYIHYVLDRIPDSDYIAPNKRPAYDALRAALGLPADDGTKWARLSRWRYAKRHAGALVNDDLRAALRDTTAWRDELQATGVSVLSIGEGLGDLELRVVVAVADATTAVGRSRLGRLLPAETSSQSEFPAWIPHPGTEDATDETTGAEEPDGPGDDEVPVVEVIAVATAELAAPPAPIGAAEPDDAVETEVEEVAPEDSPMTADALRAAFGLADDRRSKAKDTRKRADDRSGGWRGGPR